MTTLSAQMDILVEKTKNLILLCEALQEENDLLKLENQSLQVALDSSKAKVQEMDEQLKALTIAKTFEEGEKDNELVNKKVLDTKRRIDEFVREIDKCIDMLK